MELDEEQDREKREVPSREAPQCAAPPHAVSSCQNNDMAPSYKIKPLQRGILSGICFSFPLHTYYYTFSFFFFRSSACLLFSLGIVGDVVQRARRKRIVTLNRSPQFFVLCDNALFCFS